MNQTKPIILPAGSIPYILLQRTQYLGKNVVFKLLTVLGLLSPLYKLSITIKSGLFAAQIEREFNQDMKNEFATIKKHLPSDINSVLDIGCGVAGIDVLISRYYRNNLDVFLIDKTRVDDTVYYKFEKTGTFYNSLQISQKMLEINGVSPDRVHTQEATAHNDIEFKQKFDVVISLISWGFHYPISTYLDQVYQKLLKNGVLIVDVRKNTDGETAIKAKFGSYQVILDQPKFIRVLARKK